MELAMATDERVPYGNLFPELVHFEDYATRQRELKAASKSILRQFHRQLALVVFLIGSAAALGLLIVNLKFLFGPNTSLLGGVASGICGGASAVMGNLLYRKPIRVILRNRLNEIGVPICVGCGYDLRGNTSGVCPECGRVTPGQPVER